MADKIYLTGHRGMVGSAIMRKLEARGNRPIVRAHAELDLTNQKDVRDFFHREKPDAVIMAAAKVGGIRANNTYPAEFIYENLMMECNIIHQAFEVGVRRLLFLGSSCIYPHATPQPMREEALLTGVLEPSNEPYAIAKIAGIKLCESYNRQYGTDYRSVMPSNSYGPGDNFHPENSHVVPALIRRFSEAVETGCEQVVIWGTGTPRREFLHVADVADACLFVMDLSEATYFADIQPIRSHINIGYGDDVSIAELASIIAEVAGFKGKITFDRTQPDGAARRLIDNSRLCKMGWVARIPLREGIRETYRWFLANRQTLRE